MHILCTICTDLVNPTENLHATNCGHLFHHECLTSWIERSNTCPQCRRLVTDACIFRVYPTMSDEMPRELAALQGKLDEAASALHMCNDNEALLKVYTLELDCRNSEVETLKLKLDSEQAMLRMRSAQNESLKNRVEGLVHDANMAELKYVGVKSKYENLQKLYATQCVETERWKDENNTLKKNIQIMKKALWKSEFEKFELRKKLGLVEDACITDKFTTLSQRLKLGQLSQRNLVKTLKRLHAVLLTSQQPGNNTNKNDIVEKLSKMFAEGVVIGSKLSENPYNTCNEAVEKQAEISPNAIASRSNSKLSENQSNSNDNLVIGQTTKIFPDGSVFEKLLSEHPSSCAESVSRTLPDIVAEDIAKESEPLECEDSVNRSPEPGSIPKGRIESKQQLENSSQNCSVSPILPNDTGLIDDAEFKQAFMFPTDTYRPDPQSLEASRTVLDEIVKKAIEENFLENLWSRLQKLKKPRNGTLDNPVDKPQLELSTAVVRSKQPEEILTKTSLKGFPLASTSEHPLASDLKWRAEMEQRMPKHLEGTTTQNVFATTSREITTPISNKVTQSKSQSRKPSLRHKRVEKSVPGTSKRFDFELKPQQTENAGKLFGALPKDFAFGSIPQQSDNLNIGNNKELTKLLPKSSSEQLVTPNSGWYEIAKEELTKLFTDGSDSTGTQDSFENERDFHFKELFISITKIRWPKYCNTREYVDIFKQLASASRTNKTNEKPPFETFLKVILPALRPQLGIKSNSVCDVDGKERLSKLPMFFESQKKFIHNRKYLASRVFKFDAARRLQVGNMYILCTICTDLVEPTENLQATNCGHLVHHHCLSAWIQRSNTCPQCRRQVTESCMFRVYPTISDEMPRELAKLQGKLDEAARELRICKDNEELLKVYTLELDSRNSELETLKLKLQNEQATLRRCLSDNESLKRTEDILVQGAKIADLMYTRAKSNFEELEKRYATQCMETVRWKDENDFLKKNIHIMKKALWKSEFEKFELRKKLGLVEDACIADKFATLSQRLKERQLSQKNLVRTLVRLHSVLLTSQNPGDNTNKNDIIEKLSKVLAERVKFGSKLSENPNTTCNEVEKPAGINPYVIASRSTSELSETQSNSNDKLVIGQTTKIVPDGSVYEKILSKHPNSCVESVSRTLPDIVAEGIAKESKTKESEDSSNSFWDFWDFGDKGFFESKQQLENPSENCKVSTIFPKLFKLSKNPNPWNWWDKTTRNVVLKKKLSENRSNLERIMSLRDRLIGHMPKLFSECLINSELILNLRKRLIKLTSKMVYENQSKPDMILSRRVRLGLPSQIVSENYSNSKRILRLRGRLIGQTSKTVSENQSNSERILRLKKRFIGQTTKTVSENFASKSKPSTASFEEISEQNVFASTSRKTMKEARKFVIHSKSQSTKHIEKCVPGTSTQFDYVLESQQTENAEKPFGVIAKDLVFGSIPLQSNNPSNDHLDNKKELTKFRLIELETPDSDDSYWWDEMAEMQLQI